MPAYFEIHDTEVQFVGSWNIYKCAKIKNELVEYLEAILEKDSLTINISSLEQFDLAALQVLISLIKECRERQKEVKMIGENKKVEDLFKNLNITFENILKG